MSTLRINNIEAQSVPASPTIDEKVKVTNSSGDILVNIDGKTSGITTIGINTTDGNIKFDANSNVLITGILTATTLAGNFTPDSLEIGSNIKLGNAGVVTATSFVGSGANLTNLPSQLTLSNNADNRVITGGSGTNLNGEANLTFNGTNLMIGSTGAEGALSIRGSANSTQVMISDHTSATLRIATATGALSQIFVEAGQSIVFGHGTNSGLSNERLRIDSSGRLLIGTTTEGHPAGDNLTVADSGHAGITIRSGTTSNGALYFSDGTSGADEYRGGVVYHHDGNYMRFYTNGTERIRIDSGGTFHVKTNGMNLENATATNSRGYSITNAAGTTGWTFGNGITASTHQYVIYDNTAGSARFQINGNGAFGLNGGNYGAARQVMVSNGSGSAVSWSSNPFLLDMDSLGDLDYDGVFLRYREVNVSGNGLVYLGLCKSTTNCPAGRIGCPVGYVPGVVYNSQFRVDKVGITPWPDGSGHRYEYFAIISDYVSAGKLGIFYLTNSTN